jgi:hypothetical protein
MLSDIPPPCDVHAQICHERLRQSKAWFTSQVELWTSAIDAHKRQLRLTEQDRYESVKASIRDRLVSEYRNLSPKDLEAIRDYLDVRPSRLPIWKVLKHWSTTGDRPPRPRSPPEDGGLAAVEDHTEIEAKMQEAGVDLSSMILWSNGMIMYLGKWIREGDEIGAVGKDPECFVHATVQIITRTELKMQSQQEGVKRDIFIAREDVEAGRYDLFV